MREGRVKTLLNELEWIGVSWSKRQTNTIYEIIGTLYLAEHLTNDWDLALLNARDYIWKRAHLRERNNTDKVQVESKRKHQQQLQQQRQRQQQQQEFVCIKRKHSEFSTNVTICPRLMIIQNSTHCFACAHINLLSILLSLVLMHSYCLLMFNFIFFYFYFYSVIVWSLFPPLCLLGGCFCYLIK